MFSSLTSSFGIVAAKDHAEKLGSAGMLLCQTGWCVGDKIENRNGEEGET